MPKFDRGTLLAILLITFVGVGVRCYPAGESLWLDELHTAWTVNAEDGQLANRAQLGNNSPLYFQIVHWMTRLFGVSEWSLRLLSLIAGALLIPLTFGVCFSWRCGVLPSLLAASLVAMDRHASFYACEARPYAVVQLVALLHFALYAKLLTESDRTWTWMGWTLTGIAIFQLHCTTGLFIAAEAVAFGILLWLRYPIKIQIRYLLIGFAVIGASMVSSVGLLRVLAERRENWSHFIHATGMPLRMLSLYPLHVYVLAPAMLACVVFAAKSMLGRVGKIEQDEEISEEANNESGGANLEAQLTICLACLVLPVITAWILTELDITRVFIRRYLIASSITLAPLTAVLLRLTVSGVRATQVVALAVLTFALFMIRPNLPNRVHEDWRAAVNAMNDAPANQPLLFYSGLIEADPWWNSGDEALIEYCQFPLQALYRLTERPVVLLPRSTAPIKQVDFADLTSPTWLLIRGNDKTTDRVAQLVRHSLGKSWSIQQQSAYGRLTLFQLADSQPATSE